MTSNQAEIKYQRLGWSITEYCELLGISKGTFYNRQKDGIGPRVLKLGTRSIVTPEAHAAFLEKHGG
jgi:predicted DNA-binding transcriptional regulator AlpA